jgi:3-oxo-5alpha-steroid 4-dehydrogenase
MLFGKKKAEDVEELSAKFGFDANTLTETIDSYNRSAREQTEDPFGKTPDDVRGLKAPFHVIDISLGATLLPCTVLTMGGLVVNEETGQVRRDDGSEIEGLYAAGRTAVGIPSNLYMSGLSIADCIFSGRRAARHAAQPQG